MKLWRRIVLAWRVLRGCDLAAENERLRLIIMGDPSVVELHVEQGSIEASLHHSLAPLMAEHMAQLLEIVPGKDNYLTVDFLRRKTGARYTLTIQRQGGRTPAQDLAELRAQVAANFQGAGAQ